MKPVQGHTLLSMREMGLTASTKHIRSARVVSDVIGKPPPPTATSRCMTPWCA